MSYVREMISELEGYSLAAGGGVVDKYISTKNCTGLLIGVQCLENGATVPTRANIATKLGTIEVWASTKDGGGPQVSYDFDDLPALNEKLFGLPQPSVIGTQTDNRYQHIQYFLPLSPNPLLPTFGFRDARLKITYSGTETASDTYLIWVGAILHDVKPSYYIQSLLHTETGVASNGKVDEDMTEGGHFMGAYAFSTTSLQDLQLSDAATINDFAVVVDNSELSRLSNRVMHAEYPPVTYLTSGTTVASSEVDGFGGTSYHFWDTGWKLSKKDGQLHGIPIGRNYKLRMKTNAADAIRAYHFTALPVGPN